MHSIIIQDNHLGRVTDSDERVKIKEQAIKNIVTYLGDLRQGVTADLQVIFNGDIVHGMVPEEFNLDTAQRGLKPLVEALDELDIEAEYIAGNWDPIIGEPTPDWQDVLQDELMNIAGVSPDRFAIRTPKLYVKHNTSRFTHGHLVPPNNISIVLKRALGMNPSPDNVKRILGLGKVDTAELIYGEMEHDRKMHAKADKILAIQEWFCKLPVLGAMARAFRARLDAAMQASFAANIKEQFIADDEVTIFSGHTHTVDTSGPVINVGTSGADMRSCATFGVVDPEGEVEVLSAWHPEAQDTVVPYADVQHLRVPKHLRSRSYVLGK